MDAADLHLTLELARTHEPQDPYAFRFEPQTYTLRTDGGGREVLEIDWSEQLLGDLEALRRPDREPSVVQRVGDVLARFLERASWPSRASAISRTHDAGGRVLITIRSAAAELYALPWELLTLPGRGVHVGTLPRVLLRYERPETTTREASPSPRPEGGRILLAWSAAAGAVPAAAHDAALRRACAKGHPEGEAALEVLPHASVEGIVDALSRAQREGRPFAALHLLCHGGRKGKSFGLVLDGDDRPVTVAADTWRTMLSPRVGGLRLVVLAACEGGNAGEPGNHLGSVAQALHAVGLEAVVASRHPLSTKGSVTLTESLYEQLLVRHASLEDALMHGRARLALDPTHLDWGAVQLYAREEDGFDTRPFVFRPYRGLLAFDAAHASFFHGREVERREIVRCLEGLEREGKPRLVVVAGASGTGKSSLVLAGAVPDILATRGDHWEHALVRPGSDPLAALDAALAARKDESQPLLLVIDQFEEIFTHTADREVRLEYVRRLWSLVSDDTGVRCILLLRVDFLGRCGELRLSEHGPRLDSVAYDHVHRVFVAQMSQPQLEAAITLPAQQVGLRLPEGLAERIVSEVGVEPGALPLLQYTLDLMWQRRRGRELGVEVYEELGGVIGSLERRADALVDALSDDELQLARLLLTQLVGLGEDDTGDTRRRVPIEQLWPDDPRQRPVAEAVLRHFVDERLVVRDDRNRGGATAEIAHEALIRRWDRLREWLGSERERRIGRYVVLERISERSREELQLGYDPDLDRRVVIRSLRVGRGGAKERTRLRDQARALARLSHPNAQAVYDVGIARGHVYLAMELVEGIAVRDWKREGSWEWSKVVALFVQIADALVAAHDLGLVHRGISPEVIRVDAQGVPHLVEFGLDRRSEASHSSRSDATLMARFRARQSGPLPQASPGGLMPLSSMEVSALVSVNESSVTMDSTYLPPELLRGLPYDAASDQFGFCLSLYEVLLGQPPFAREGIAGFAQAVAATGRSTAGQGEIPEALSKVLLRGLVGNPEGRWPSMAALRDELRAVLPARMGRTARTTEGTSTGRARWLGLAVAVGLAAGGLSWLGLAELGGEQPGVTVPPCPEGEPSLDGVWDDAKRHAVRDALFATSRPHAVAIWKEIEPQLDAAASGWMERKANACESGEAEPSDAMLRRACLDVQRVELRETVEVLTRATPDTLDHAAALMSGLSELERCDDIEAPAIERLDRMVGARVRLRGGDARGAQERAQEVLDAIGDDPGALRVEALLVRGAARMQLQRSAEGRADLREALLSALEQQLGKAHPGLEQARAWLEEPREAAP
ncbi:nSTAND1 domain-containing NTPase [Paraliomyxa miuraensis]|uniref:nSTAND1 domain-containing NTPase n=1 Tax=Paraliomyxa miuraensis TaxID=376150 RepID=UPI00224D5C29|nr:CHAT domain-containing protein [Paraliomyxa miuraensis]MCX4240567.1 CHAT domain-containing protein [Paraliomyxa miuraensis]